MMIRKGYMVSMVLTILLTLLLAACAQTQDDTMDDNPGTDTDDEPTAVQDPTFTMEEVAQHDTRDDCWIAIDGKVYDVTDFITSHPGGSAILEGCGTDGSELYETRPMGSGTPHSARARDMLQDYHIGDVEG